MLRKLLGIAFWGSLALAQNLVQNPGFETGSLPPWVANGWGVLPLGIGVPHTGTYYAETPCAGAACISPDPSGSGAWLYQDLATVPGATYTLSFFYFPGTGGGGTIELQALWGPSGSPLTTGGAGICSGNCVFHSASSGAAYTQFTVTGLTASSSSTRLEFLGRQDSSLELLDDIVVTQSSPSGVPVPPSIWLTLVGLACAAFYFGWRGLAGHAANERNSL